MQTRKELVNDFKKKLIADAAGRLFRASSFESVSVDNIAREAEIGKGTIYYYFESKEEILAFVIYQGIEKLCDIIRSQIGLNDGFLITLEKIIDLQYYYYLTYNPLFISLLHCQANGKLPDELLDPIKKKHLCKQELISAVLRQGMDAGLIKSQDLDHLAGGIEYTIKGFGLMRMENRYLDKGSNNLQLLKDILFQGIVVS